MGCMDCSMMKPCGMVIQKPTVGTPIDTGTECMHSFWLAIPRGFDPESKVRLLGYVLRKTYTG